MKAFALDSGVDTGPADDAAAIGGSAPGHIDTNWNGLVSVVSGKAVDVVPGGMETLIELMDANALFLAESGKRIEFSNAAVAGQVWDPNMSPDEKRKMAEDVMLAHRGHSKATAAMDWYVVNNDGSRGDASSMNADMPVAVKEDWQVVYAVDPKDEKGYGMMMTVLDENGNAVFKQGHGNKRLNKPDDFIVTAEHESTQSVAAVPNAPSPVANETTANGWLSSLDSNEIAGDIEEDGVADTFEKVTGMMPDMFQGMEGMLMLVFAFVMMASGAEQSEITQATDSIDPKERNNPSSYHDALSGRDQQIKLENLQEGLPNIPEGVRNSSVQLPTDNTDNLQNSEGLTLPVLPSSLTNFNISEADYRSLGNYSNSVNDVREESAKAQTVSV